MLQAKGLKSGEFPELAALEHPDWLEEIHRAYVDAGAQIVYANTFGANREKLSRFGRSVDEVVAASVAAARRAADGRALVALDVGPIGQLLEPTGLLPFEQAADIFTEVIRAGVKAGADLVVIETVADLQEARAALIAAKENCSLPVMVTMTYEERGRTFLGCPPSAAALTLEGLGADAIGLNCSLGPRQMVPVAEELLNWTTLPVIIKPNAGLPRPDGSGYDVTPDEFAAALSPLVEAGVQLFGGCCGTTPEYIARLRTALAGRTVGQKRAPVPTAVCSSRRVVPLDRVRVIGERINPTGKKLMKEALRRGDMDYILDQAVSQTQAGADILDVNVGLPEIDEREMMIRAVKAIQSVTDAPLQLDSSDPAALEAALRVCCGKAIVNSVNGKRESLETVLPIVKKYGAAVVGLTLDEDGIPASAEKRFAIARRILDAALAIGIRREDVYIDCLTLTVSAEQAAAAQTLSAVRRVKEELGLKTVLGVSNISFGLPARPIINQNFLALAMANGLDLPILNPNAEAMMAAVRAYHLLTGLDADAREFIAAYGDAAPAAQAPAPSGTRALDELVALGLKGEAAAATRALLDLGRDPMEIINSLLIPALDRVGAEFEAGRQFLPQLIQSAGAAQSAFDVLRERMTDGTEKPSQGTIVLATVKGDIHDIGKNILKVLLENYGFTVIDLGRDVPPEAVVEAARKYDAPLVALSALMTTTLRSMEETIRLLRRELPDRKVMVGGAVLTEDYAAAMGADFYGADAKQSVDYARRLFGTA